MRIKVTPEDFIVKEIVNIPLSPSRGRYRIYLLKKAGWNTLDAIDSIARSSGVDASAIGYAGLKDRHALTSQYISVPAARTLVSSRGDLTLTFLGYSDDFISTKVLVGNRFDIRIGGLTPSETEAVGRFATGIRDYGFPNYFDDQRFGSVTPEGDFLAERLLRGHLKGALKIHLSTVFPTQKRAERENRAKIASVWGKWEEVLSLCSSEEDRAVANPLVAGASKKNLIAALNAVPREAMARYIAAYQAFIWNEVLRRLIAGQTSAEADQREVEGKVGPYVFPDSECLRSLAGVEIPTVSARVPECPPHILEAITDVLAERGISFRDFNIRGLRSGYFKSFARRAVVIPEGFSVTPPARDRERFEFREVTASFTLPAGSYATMLLKALTAGVR